jgi:hypothetical protein
VVHHMKVGGHLGRPLERNLSLWRFGPDAEAIARDRARRTVNNGYFGMPTNRAPVNLPSSLMSGA